jgi:predicted outer membrane repeat protein
LTNSTLSGNSAIGGGGAILNEPYRPVYLTNSTLSYNSASHGGAISTRYDSDVLVTNCTLSGNSATLKGGAVYVGDLGAVLLKSSTLSGNSGSGGAIRTYFAWVGLDDTIIANSSSGQNCVTGGDLDDLGNNFSDDDSCGPGFADITPGVDFETELTDNGGPTLTHALLPWSVAMDAAGECGLDTDQRGFPRSDGVCDSGSVEFQGGSGVPASSRVGVIVLLAVLAALSVILRPKRGARRPST